MGSKLLLAFTSIWYSILMFLPDEFSKLRVRYYNSRGCKIHNSCSISPNVRIRGRVIMGEFSSIAQNCTLTGGDVGIHIGRDVMIAPNVVIVAFNHIFKDINAPIRTQGDMEMSIEIGDDVWIGANCTICAGVKIGKGVIVGANSLVNKNIDDFSIIGGVPAKTLKVRI